MIHIFLAILLTMFFIGCDSPKSSSLEETCYPYSLALDSFTYNVAYFPDGASEQSRDLLSVLDDDNIEDVSEKYGLIYDFHFKVQNLIDDTLFFDFKNQQMVIDGDTVIVEDSTLVDMFLLEDQDTTIVVTYAFAGNTVAPNTIKTVGEDGEKEFEIETIIETSSPSTDECANSTTELQPYTFKEKKEREPLTESQQLAVDIVVGIFGAILKSL